MLLGGHLGPLHDELVLLRLSRGADDLERDVALRLEEAVDGVDAVVAVVRGFDLRALGGREERRP